MLNTRRCVNTVSRRFSLLSNFTRRYFFDCLFVNVHRHYRSCLSVSTMWGCFFFADNLLCNLTSWLELLFLRYAIAPPFDISPSVFYETWLRTLKFRKLQKRPGALKTMFCLVKYNPLLNITSCKLQSRARQHKKVTCIMFHRGRDKRDLREIISKAPNFNERA